MTERFSQGFLDRIIAATDVGSVIGRFTALKRRGNKLVGLCPFHKEKTPSFTVDPDRGLYYCFGCHAGGSIFNFLMEKEGLTFYQSVELLARESGIELPKLKSGGKSKDDTYEAADYGARFFQKALKADIGGEARDYLKSRGISGKTWEVFGLGWAPADRNHLVTSVEKARKETESFLEIGLLAKSDRGKLYAKINDALVFPISTSSGRIVGFAHRRIREDPNYTGPKYINSADNDIYHKSSILYGLAQARAAIRREKKTVLVEGYFDVIALADKGIDNAVATCGTALTSEQANLLARFAPTVIVIFDGDEAGLRATLRSLEILLEAGLNVSIVRLPEGEDPDSFVLAEGSSALTDIIEIAPDWFDWLYDFGWGESEGSGVTAAVSVVDRIAIPLGSISDSMKRNLYVRELSKRLSIDEKSVLDHLRRSYQKQRSRFSESSDIPTHEELPARAKLELSLVAAVLHSNSGDNGENPLTLYPGLWEKAVGGYTPAEILSEIADERARGYLSATICEGKSENIKFHCEMLRYKLSRMNIQEKIESIQNRLREIGNGENKEEEATLLGELNSLVRKLNDLGKTTIK